MQKIQIRESPIEGKGIFATEPIKKGEVVLEWKAQKIVDSQEFQNLSTEQKSHTIYVGNNTYYVVDTPGRYINHSCDPNTYVKDKKDIALRDIKAGDEITSDYDLIAIDEQPMNCFCGATNCRGVVVGDFRKLKPQVQKQKYRYVQDWLKKELNI